MTFVFLSFYYTTSILYHYEQQLTSPSKRAMALLYCHVDPVHPSLSSHHLVFAGFFFFVVLLAPHSSTCIIPSMDPWTLMILLSLCTFPTCHAMPFHYFTVLELNEKR